MNVDGKTNESQKPSGRRGFIDVIHTLFRKRNSNACNEVPNISHLSHETVNDLASTTNKEEPFGAINEQVEIDHFQRSYTCLSSETKSHSAPSNAKPVIDNIDDECLTNLPNNYQHRRFSNVSVASTPENLAVISAGYHRNRAQTSASVVTWHYRSTIKTFRDLDKDLELLRLSRNDNPVVQKKMMESYVSEPDVAFSKTSQQPPLANNSELMSQSDCDAETLVLKPLLVNPPRIQADFLTPNDYHPSNVIQQHLIRSPPPYITAIRQFSYEIGRTSTSSDSERDEIHQPDTCTCEAQNYYVHAEEIQRAPLPHVRQSCPMFRPLVTMQKGIFQDHRKQPKDLRPLLSLSSNDVIDPSSYPFTKNRRRHFEVNHHHHSFSMRPDGPESTSTSPSIQVFTKRSKRRAMLQSRHPVTYPLQKTI